MHHVDNDSTVIFIGIIICCIAYMILCFVFLSKNSWKQIKDRFLLATGDTYTNGATGGEASHTLTVNEMPVPNHKQNNALNFVDNRISSNGKYRISDVQVNNIYTDNTGGNQPHNNMPPYWVVNIWKRVA